MSWHKFGATCTADTCLWCGRGLRRRHHVERERADKKRPPAKCDRELGPGLTCDSRSFSPSNDGFRCNGCDDWHMGRYAERITKREPAHAKPGDYGDGFFCGLRCAYQFAVRLAQLDYRVVAKKEGK